MEGLPERGSRTGSGKELADYVPPDMSTGWRRAAWSKKGEQGASIMEPQRRWEPNFLVGAILIASQVPQKAESAEVESDRRLANSRTGTGWRLEAS